MIFIIFPTKLISTYLILFISFNDLIIIINLVEVKRIYQIINVSLIQLNLNDQIIDSYMDDIIDSIKMAIYSNLMMIEIIFVLNCFILMWMEIICYLNC